MSEQSPRIDEWSRRWSTEVSGQEIALPDGQVWTFFMPEARPGDDLAWSFGDVPADLDAVLSAKLRASVHKYLNATNDTDRACAAVEVAWRLLMRNYSVAPDEFEAILSHAAAWDEARQRELAASLNTLVLFTLGRAAMLRSVA